VIQQRLIWIGILLSIQALALLLICFSACGAILAAVWTRSNNKYAHGWAIAFAMIEMFLVFCLVVGKITVTRAEVEEEKKGGASAAPTTSTLHPASY
jgi:hypothetical protein